MTKSFKQKIANRRIEAVVRLIKEALNSVAKTEYLTIMYLKQILNLLEQEHEK